MENYLLPQGHTESVAELSPYKTLVAMVLTTLVVPEDFSYTPPPHVSSLLWGMSNQRLCTFAQDEKLSTLCWNNATVVGS